jgi:hypothetical protein
MTSRRLTVRRGRWGRSRQIPSRPAGPLTCNPKAGYKTATVTSDVNRTQTQPCQRVNRRVYSIDTQSRTYRTRPLACRGSPIPLLSQDESNMWVGRRECYRVYTIDTPNLEARVQAETSINFARTSLHRPITKARHNRSSRRKKARRKRALTLSRKIVQKCSPELA